MLLEIGIFVAGLFAKAVAGMIVGIIMRKGITFAEQESKLIMKNDKEEQITQHVYMEHRTPYKMCRLDQCASF